MSAIINKEAALEAMSFTMREIVSRIEKLNAKYDARMQEYQTALDAPADAVYYQEWRDMLPIALQPISEAIIKVRPSTNSKWRVVPLAIGDTPYYTVGSAKRYLSGWDQSKPVTALYKAADGLIVIAFETSEHIHLPAD